MQPRHILIYGVSWLGDSVMTMPALRRFIDEYPTDKITMLAKPALGPLWAMFPGLSDFIPTDHSLRGHWHTVRHLRGRPWDAVYILPHSAHSAIVPFCADIPERIGAEGHECPFLLTRVVPLPSDPQHHQALEYVNVFGVSVGNGPLPPPRLQIPPPIQDAADNLLDGPGPWIGLVPGAARGPSKRWPASHFAAAGHRLVAETAARCLVLGSSEEAALCQTVCDGIGPAAMNLAGRATLPQLAALLGRCHAVVTNDSGGMHLAAAMGTQVVAVFGLTDPCKTGPLGSRHRIVRAEDVEPSRDIGRNSIAARRALESISPERVATEAIDALRASSPRP